MRSRLQIHIKALTFSFSAVGALMFLVFFFYDGPLPIPAVEPEAMATEASSTVARVLPEKVVRLMNVKPTFGIFASNLHPQWHQVSLDQDQVRLNVLKSPLLLSQTHHQVGSEAFHYASYLFEQMAHTIKSPSLAGELQALSLQAQHMGNAVAQADSFRFAGPPTSDMEHLQVRSSILYYLSGLNTRPVVNVKYNQNGKILTPHTAASLSSVSHSGQVVQEFMAHANALLSQPAAKAYPQTMKLVKEESRLISDLASHMTMRWESTLDCPQSCSNVAVYLRIYAHQDLPKYTLAAINL